MLHIWSKRNILNHILLLATVNLVLNNKRKKNLINYLQKKFKFSL